MYKSLHRDEETLWLIRKGRIQSFNIIDKRKYNNTDFDTDTVAFFALITTPLTSILGLNALLSKVSIIVLILFVTIVILVVVRITTVTIINKTLKNLIKTQKVLELPIEYLITRRKLIKIVLVGLTITAITLILMFVFQDNRFITSMFYGISLYVVGILYDSYDFKKQKIKK